MDIPALPLQNQEGRGRGTVPAPSLDSHLFFGGARPSHRFVRDLYFDLSTHYTISLCGKKPATVYAHSIFREGRNYSSRVLVPPGFGEAGRGCSSITALLVMQFLFL